MRLMTRSVRNRFQVRPKHLNTPNQLSKKYPARNRNTNLLSDKNVIILFRML